MTAKAGKYHGNHSKDRKTRGNDKYMEKDEDKDCSLTTMGPTEYLIMASLKLYKNRCQAYTLTVKFSARLQRHPVSRFLSHVRAEFGSWGFDIFFTEPKTKKSDI